MQRGGQRSIRKKSVLSFDEDEEGQEEGSMGAPPASVKALQAQKEKEHKKKAEKKGLLSFEEEGGGGGEEDGPSAAAATAKRATGGSAAAAGKPRSSLRAPGVPQPGASEDQAGLVYTQRAAAGEYSRDRLQELARNTKTLPAAAKPPSLTLVGGAGLRVAGSFKPAGAPKDDRFRYNVNAAAVVQQRPAVPPAAAAAMRAAGGAELPPPPGPPPPAAAGAPVAAAAPPPSMDAGEEEEEEEEEEDAIPDEEMIAWAKAKRERLRSAHLAPDYIPTAAAPPGLNRLRDKKKAEDEAAAAAASGSGSEDELEEQMRLQFMGQQPPAQRPVLGAAAAAAAGGGSGAGAAAAEEEEDERWAQEQIRKGMGGLLREGGGGGAGDGIPPPPPGAPPPDSATAPRAGVLAGAAAGASQEAAIRAAGDEALAALAGGLARARAAQAQAERNLTRTEGSLRNSLAAVERMDGELQGASAKYVYVQKLRAYVADLCFMLQDKSPLVEELQEAHLGLCQERARSALERRRLDDAEAHDPAEAAISAAMGVLSRGGSTDAAGKAAEAAAAATEQRLLGGDLPVELDEFGRDANGERRREAAQRAQQRDLRLEAQEQQWQAAQQGAGASSAPEPRPGEESSDESDAEAASFKRREDEVLEAADAVFRDAADEFGSVAAVKRQLEEWKARYPGPYRDAYVSLSAPALFAPFVRLELLKWRPLHGGEPGFDGHQWYQQLFDYGMPEDPAAADPNDPGTPCYADLLPRLVQKLVLPLAQQLLEGTWDPQSRRQSQAAAAMVGDLLVYVPPEDETMQEVLRLVQGKLEESVAAVALPPWPPAALAASRRARLHLAQRFHRGVRLLHAVCAFEGVLPRGPLQRQALERLLQQQLLPYARCALGTPAVAADRAARLAAALPPDWFQAGPPRGAQGLHELLSSLARTLEGQASNPAAAAAALPAAQQVAGALLRLGDNARGNYLNKAFGVL